MEEIRDLVVRATAGGDSDERVQAYGQIVERFRDMACGYAYSILGDFHLAEDAAQEAFVTAYRTLDQLRDPAAFAGWFRRIVWSQCGRISRRSEPAVADVARAGEMASDAAGPSAAAEAAEMDEQVRKAIAALPEPQREVTTLFYINGYSQRDISQFLEVPVSTVKNRLTASRKQLKERMLDMVKDTLRSIAPDERFDRAVIDKLLARPRPLEIPGHPVREVAMAIRAALPGFEDISGNEIVDNADFERITEHSASLDRAYRLGDRKALRTETTITIMAAMVGRNPPVKLLVAGRVFRPDTEDGRHLKVFHQLDVLWIEAGLTSDDMKASIATAVGAVLGGAELRWQVRISMGYDSYMEFAALWNGCWVNIGGCGMLKAETLRAAGYEDETLRGVSYGLGLDRLAAVKYGIEDVRILWQPPYVEGGQGQ